MIRSEMNRALEVLNGLFQVLFIELVEMISPEQVGLRALED